MSTITPNGLYHVVTKMMDDICQKYPSINVSSYLDPASPKSLNDILRRLIISAQNSSVMSRVIDYDSNKASIDKILYFYAPELLKKETPFSLYRRLRSVPSWKNGKCWSQWCKAIVSCTHFVESFSSLEDFQNLGNFFLCSPNPTIQAGFPLYISNRVFGLNFALSCDALKELGYTQFAKPDRQIKDVLAKASILKPTDYDDDKTYTFDVEVMMVKIACGITGKSRYLPGQDVSPYELDKLIWLLCTGDFYQSKPSFRIGSSKTRLIDALLKLKSGKSCVRHYRPPFKPHFFSTTFSCRALRLKTRGIRRCFRRR